MNNENENDKRWRGKPGKTPHLWISKKGMDMASTRGIICLAVYTVLARAESDAPPEYKANFLKSEESLASLCGCSEKTINRYTEILQNMGLIRKVSGRVKKYKEGHSANCYTVLEIEGEQTYSPTSGREPQAPSSLKEPQTPSKKESLSSPSEKERHLSKKSADAGTPPGKPGGSDSAPEKPWSCVGNF
jgi:hypothetical protein